MPEHGKRYRTAREAIDREKLYSPLEAIRILKGAPAAKYDETVEVHFNTGLNVRHAEQQLRGTLMLPHGTGKETRVAVFAEGEKAKEAQDAGADVVGSADLAAQIEGGFDDFDVTIATPDMMGTVGKLGRILGPRGKMPNPKAGTVTFDVGEGGLATPRPASSSTGPTAARTSICRSARRASTSASCSRTTRSSSTRSCGPSPPPRRAATSARSPWRAPWGRASRSIRRARAAWSKSSRRRRQKPSRNLNSPPETAGSPSGRKTSRGGPRRIASPLSGPPSRGPSRLRR